MKINGMLVAGSTKSFFDSSVAAQSTNGSKAPEKAAPRQSSPTRASSGGGGFFDSSVGSQFANRSESPKKAAPAPRQSSPTKASSGGGFFDSSVGSQFANRSESPRRAAPKQASSPRSSSGKGFFDSPAPSSTSGKQLLPLSLRHSQVIIGCLSACQRGADQSKAMTCAHVHPCTVSAACYIAWHCSLRLIVCSSAFKFCIEVVSQLG